MKSSYRNEKKDDDERIHFFHSHTVESLPYENVNKNTVLQESRTFNETPVNPGKCSYVICSILYLLGQGETFSTQEATEIFFNLTKLFISDNV